MTRRTVSVFGLGHVGLPLALLCSRKGYKVIGVDSDEAKIAMIRRGISPVKDKNVEGMLKNCKIEVSLNGVEAAKVSDVILICVPTPVDVNKHPDLSYLISASKTIAEGLARGERGKLIVVESTVYPGTTEGILRPILEKSGKKCGRDFYLAHCPERIDPGNKKWNISNIPRVIGGVDEESLKRAEAFYRSILDAEIFTVSSARVAEAVKLVENAFRDINIAFVNELAKAFDILGIDIVEVLRAASTKPFGFMVHYPGAGVGGHCIAVDPYYLIDKASEVNFSHQFLRLARVINDSMPGYVIEKVVRGLNEIGQSVKNTVITVLGVAYKGGVGDHRNSPALRIIDELRRMGGELKIFDPYIPEMSNCHDLNSALEGSVCVVLVTDHPEFKEIKLEYLKEKGIKVLVDGRNIYDKEKAKKIGLIYKGIGRGER
ncbi:MAG: nucleotide sugar dehydrogenase [Candidatus Freyarchaeota archaeon]